MRNPIAGLVAASILLILSVGAKAGVATGCPMLADSYMTGANAGIVWSLTNGGAIRFQPDGMYYDNESHVDPLTPAQLAGYASVLDDFRAAASTKRKLNVYWDDTTKKVRLVEVLWTLSC